MESSVPAVRPEHTTTSPGVMSDPAPEDLAFWATAADLALRSLAAAGSNLQKGAILGAKSSQEGPGLHVGAALVSPCR